MGDFISQYGFPASLEQAELLSLAGTSEWCPLAGRGQRRFCLGPVPSVSQSAPQAQCPRYRNCLASWALEFVAAV